ncbi:uncharacterized protein ATC70_004892 [Mucor velutinosus]|uniref:Uncharacterized protein n=1 Tax=Mucor velutinosus TaxID=708070 RepID=A0AAN7D4X3_9FUNG|nr:hypothetical protein ATC70_004892 [Mucor velutinosus]
MKFSLLSAIFVGLAATFVLAEDEPHYFFFPNEGAEFSVTDQITFAMNGITNDADETIIAKLFNAEDDSEVKQIGSYTGDTIVRPDDDDEWTFTWVIDVEPGTYYVRLYEQDADGQIDDDDEWDNEIISYDFRIRDYSSKRKRAALKRSQNMKKRAAANALKKASL